MSLCRQTGGPECLDPHPATHSCDVTSCDITSGKYHTALLTVSAALSHNALRIGCVFVCEAVTSKNQSCASPQKLGLQFCVCLCVVNKESLRHFTTVVEDKQAAETTFYGDEFLLSFCLSFFCTQSEDSANQLYEWSSPRFGPRASLAHVHAIILNLVVDAQTTNCASCLLCIHVFVLATISSTISYQDSWVTRYMVHQLLHRNNWCALKKRNCKKSVFIIVQIA